MLRYYFLDEDEEEKILTIFRDGVCFNITTQSSLGISCEEIDEIHIKDFSNTDIKNHFEKDKMTLRVPTSKADSVGMRSLSSPDVVGKAMSTLKGRARVKRAMWSRRAQEYEQKINSGDLISIAEVIRDLHRNDEQREQSYSERQLYEAALERLTREVAAVDGVEEEKAQVKVGAVLDGKAA